MRTNYDFAPLWRSTIGFDRFFLADYVQVKGASSDNGLLQIELVREIPEAMKPRRISISGSGPSVSNVQTLDAKTIDAQTLDAKTAA